MSQLPLEDKALMTVWRSFSGFPCELFTFTWKERGQAVLQHHGADRTVTPTGRL